jgi:hypothetical protein
MRRTPSSLRPSSSSSTATTLDVATTSPGRIPLSPGGLSLTAHALPAAATTVAVTPIAAPLTVTYATSPGPAPAPTPTPSTTTAGATTSHGITKASTKGDTRPTAIASARPPAAAGTAAAAAAAAAAPTAAAVCRVLGPTA